jgi:hypothetical protein
LYNSGPVDKKEAADLEKIEGFARNRLIEFPVDYLRILKHGMIDMKRQKIISFENCEDSML